VQGIQDRIKSRWTSKGDVIFTLQGFEQAGSTQNFREETFSWKKKNCYVSCLRGVDIFLIDRLGAALYTRF